WPQGKGSEAEAPYLLARPLQLLGGAVRIDDAEHPQRAGAELAWDPDRQADHARVKAQVEQVKTAYAQQKAETLQVVAEIKVAQARHDGQGRGQPRAFARPSDRGGVAA